MARALIIEDEALIALDLQDELQRLGIELLGVARTSDEALELLRQGDPDLAIVDLMLNGTAHGASIADALRARGVKVLITSGGDGAEISGKGHAFLPKPWARDDLRRALGVLPEAAD